jgi:ActD protein
VSRGPVRGLMAEFASAEAIVVAARAAREAGCRELNAYTPFSVEGLPEALGYRNTRVPLVTLLGGIAGGALGYLLQWYSAVIDYPIDSGGRPVHAWPAFIPATFELTVLGAALAAFFGLLILNGLPRLNHPVFDVPEFDLASRDRFFLHVGARNPGEVEQARRALDGLSPRRVMELT